MLKIKNGVDSLLTREQVRELGEEHQRFLNWLTPLEFGKELTDILRRRQEGTGKWFLQSQEFKEWTSTPQETLFCAGVPGAGKTMLAAIAVEQLTQYFRNNEDTGIAYVFCNFRRQAELSLEVLLAILTKQLLRIKAPSECIKEIFTQHEREKTRPSREDISKCLHSVCSLYSKVFIVIDALDECEHTQCLKLLSEMFALQTRTGVNILATSRLIPEISRRFEAAKHMEVRASEEDLQGYMEGNISRLPRCVQRDEDLHDEIKSTIVNCVDGMYADSDPVRLQLTSWIDFYSQNCTLTPWRGSHPRRQSEGPSKSCQREETHTMQHIEALWSELTAKSSQKETLLVESYHGLDGRSVRLPSSSFRMLSQLNLTRHLSTKTTNLTSKT